MKIIRDNREWEVTHIFKNADCPYLYYPANYHGCRLLPQDDDACTLEHCRHLSSKSSGRDKPCEYPEIKDLSNGICFNDEWED